MKNIASTHDCRRRSLNYMYLMSATVAIVATFQIASEVLGALDESGFPSAGTLLPHWLLTGTTVPRVTPLAAEVVPTGEQFATLIVTRGSDVGALQSGVGH